MAKLPKPVRRVVKSIGWREFCFGDEFMQNRFLKAYEIEVKREQDRLRLGGLMQLPEPVQLKALEGGKK